MKKRTHTYRVSYHDNDIPQTEYVEAKTTQEAVDIIKGNDPSVEVIAVLKVMTDWE